MYYDFGYYYSFCWFGFDYDILRILWMIIILGFSCIFRRLLIYFFSSLLMLWTIIFLASRFFWIFKYNDYNLFASSFCSIPSQSLSWPQKNVILLTVLWQIYTLTFSRAFLIVFALFKFFLSSFCFDFAINSMLLFKYLHLISLKVFFFRLIPLFLWFEKLQHFLNEHHHIFFANIKILVFSKLLTLHYLFCYVQYLFIIS